MGALDGEIWVCAECRSINNARSKQCYNCRTPSDLAAVDPSTIEGTGHGKLREVALPAFHSPRPYAIVATILILVIAGMQVVSTLNVSRLILQVLDGTPATEEQWRFIGTAELATLGIGALALVAWSLWLSRAVIAMPALGLGYPAANGLMAFFENFLPGLNLLRVPAIVRDVVRRIEPGQNRGEALIFAAWIGLLLGFVVPRVGAVATGFTAESEAAALRTTLTIAAVSTGFVLVGAIFLVALIWWIEARIGRRREAQLAAIDAATAGATEEPDASAEESVPVAYAATQVSHAASPVAQAPTVSSPWSWRDTTDSPLAASAGVAATAPAIAPGAGWDNEFAAAAVHAMPAVHATPAESPREPVPAPAPAAPSPTDASEPAEPDPVALAVPIPEPHEPVPGPPIHASQPGLPVEPEPAVVPDREPEPPRDEPAPIPPPEDRAPHLTIRVTDRGMLQAELGGETEPVILEDLTAYGNALAHAGGTAEIVLAGSDGMVHLIARRAQRILADAGIEATIPD